MNEIAYFILFELLFLAVVVVVLLLSRAPTQDWPRSLIAASLMGVVLFLISGCAWNRCSPEEEVRQTEVANAGIKNVRSSLYRVAGS